jgi:hypothetical protein
MAHDVSSDFQSGVYVFHFRGLMHDILQLQLQLRNIFHRLEKSLMILSSFALICLCIHVAAAKTMFFVLRNVNVRCARDELDQPSEGSLSEKPMSQRSYPFTKPPLHSQTAFLSLPLRRTLL